MRIYLILSVLLPVLLAYPALIYADLAGMGGYDGFASPAMMQEHGMWSTSGETTFVFRLFAAAACLWPLSVLNFLFAFGVYVLFERD